MIKNLVTHGNRWALVLDKPVLDFLNIAPDTPLEISTDGRQLVIALANAARLRRAVGPFILHRL